MLMSGFKIMILCENHKIDIRNTPAFNLSFEAFSHHTKSTRKVYAYFFPLWITNFFTIYHFKCI